MSTNKETENIKTSNTHGHFFLMFRKYFLSSICLLTDNTNCSNHLALCERTISSAYMRIYVLEYDFHQLWIEENHHISSLMMFLNSSYIVCIVVEHILEENASVLLSSAPPTNLVFNQVLLQLLVVVDTIFNLSGFNML